MSILLLIIWLRSLIGHAGLDKKSGEELEEKLTAYETTMQQEASELLIKGHFDTIRGGQKRKELA